MSWLKWPTLLNHTWRKNAKHMPLETFLNSIHFDYIWEVKTYGKPLIVFCFVLENACSLRIFIRLLEMPKFPFYKQFYLSLRAWTVFVERFFQFRWFFLFSDAVLIHSEKDILYHHRNASFTFILIIMHSTLKIIVWVCSMHRSYRASL